MATQSAQLNIWQGAETKVDIQIFTGNNIPRDLTAEGIDGIDFVFAAKSDRAKVVESPTGGTGAITDGISGKISLTINEDALDGINPSDVGVPALKEYEPAPSLFGYITLKSGTSVKDKVYLPDVAIYFEPKEA